MKSRALLIVSLFLIFSGVGFGDESFPVGNFNEYVNSPEGSSESSSGSSVDKNVNSTSAVKNEARKNPDETDTKQVLQGIPSKWQACTMDSDCTAAVADCVSWEPLNKKYLDKISKNLHSCSASIDPGFQPETLCVAKMCKTTEKTTDVSWEDWLRERRKN